MARPHKVEGREATRELLIRAAAEAFAKHGSAARLEDVAAAAGIRRASLLHHFPSKRALYAAVVAAALAALRGRLLAAAASSVGYEATLGAVIAALRAFETEESQLAAVLLRELLDAPAEDTSVEDALAEFLDVVQSIALAAGAAERARPDEVRAAIAHLVFGELARLALGQRAARFWGAADAIWPLTRRFFLMAAHENEAEPTPAGGSK